VAFFCPVLASLAPHPRRLAGRMITDAAQTMEIACA
jgi:hypothetical protein